MIDAHKTGAYIAQLRKARDWTQVELADRLHVTHQAVSRWETGDSFPDLVTLARLAQEFRVRVESLMYGGPGASSADTARDKILTELAAGHAEQVANIVKAEPSDLETVIESGPLTRPSLMTKVVKNMTGYRFSLQQVIELAPFVDQALLHSMLAGLGQKLDIKALTELAPFLGRLELADLVGKIEGTIGLQHVMELAPFVDQNALDELVGSAQGKLEGYQVIALAPFVSQSVLTGLIERLPDTDLGIDQVAELAPFMDHDALATLVGRVGMEPLKLHSLVELAPFLDRQVLTQHLQRIPSGTIDANTIVELAPFLDREALEGLIRGQRAAETAG